jgi:hypothetical protein
MSKLWSNQKKKKKYEQNRHFQNAWAMKLPWAKFVFGSKGKVVQIWCKVYTQIEHKQKLLVPNLDCLWKHVGCFGSHASGSLFLKTNIHVANEKLYFATSVKPLLQQVAHGAIVERKKKMFNC